jgi:hypothetical protein
VGRETRPEEATVTVFGVSVWWPLAGIALALIACGVGAWLVQERALREDIEDQRPDGWTRARFAASAGMREPVRLHDTVKSVKRHLRRHGRRSS